MTTILRTAILLLQVLTLQGCLGLAVYDDDPTGMIAGKVVARTLLALPTLGVSEWAMANIKTEHESHSWPVTSGSPMPLTIAPKGAVYVVLGNHPTAVNRVTEWIQRDGHLVVEHDRLRALADEQKIQLSQAPESSSDLLDLLKLGRLIGANMVVFVEVTQMSAVSVNVRSVNYLNDIADDTKLINITEDVKNRTKKITEDVRRTLDIDLKGMDRDEREKRIQDINNMKEDIKKDVEDTGEDVRRIWEEGMG